MCASVFQDGCGPSRETPPKGFPLLHSGPHPHGSLQPPRQRSSLGQVAEAGATAREGGKWRYISLQKRRLACHVTRNQIQGQSQRQCSRSGTAVVAWRVVSEQQWGVREWVSGAVNCLS